MVIMYIVTHLITRVITPAVTLFKTFKFSILYNVQNNNISLVLNNFYRCHVWFMFCFT